MFGPPVAGIGDFLGEPPHLDDPPFPGERVDVLDLERDVSQGGIRQLHSASRPNGDRSSVHGVVDGKDLGAPLADDGQTAQILTFEEGKALVFPDLLEFLTGVGWLGSPTLGVGALRCSMVA
jgi:hypothetical protein